MGKYIFKRLLMIIPVIIGVVLLVFTILYFTPADPATIILGADARPEDIEALRESLGLNQSYFERLARYLGDVFLRFDLGKSYINGISVSTEIMQRFQYTFKLASVSIILALLCGIPLGIVAAVNQYSWKDNASMLLALTGVSMPSFWVALMLSLVFALKLRWLPPSGVGGIEYYILPCIAISFSGIASIARQTRSSMLEVIRADYIVTARAKGQVERKVIYKHALQNALIPVITQAGSIFGLQLGGSMVIETIFGIPGLGSYIVTAIGNRVLSLLVKFYHNGSKNARTIYRILHRSLLALHFTRRCLRWIIEQDVEKAQIFSMSKKISYTIVQSSDYNEPQPFLANFYTGDGYSGTVFGRPRSSRWRMLFEPEWCTLY